MRRLSGLVFAAVLAAALVPEFRRYTPGFVWARSAERELRVASGAFQVVVTRPQDVPDAAGALSRIVDVARSAAGKLVEDPRPWILAGSARLVSGEPAAALESYRAALSTGERAEIDLNMARAYEALGDADRAHAAYVRAAWISPALLSLLLPDVATPLVAETIRLEHDLRAGRLKEPPPLP